MKLMLAQRVVAQNDSWEALLVREKINESQKISGVPRCHGGQSLLKKTDILWFKVSLSTNYSESSDNTVLWKLVVTSYGYETNLVMNLV